MPAITEFEPLLTVPAEALDVEYKGWLDLRNNDEHKGVLAKAAIALANEGGGYIVLGLRERRPNLISEPRPSDLAAYDQDLINQIIRRFAAPAFQCHLTMIQHPDTDVEHAVISIPGGFGFPVMSKSGTAQNSIRPHVCYMRKPGPESAAPENQADWERLLSRCLRNRREDLLDAIRTIVQGGVGEDSSATSGATSAAAMLATETRSPTSGINERQKIFVQQAQNSWQELTSTLEPSAPERCPLGRFEMDYALVGDFDVPSLTDFLEMLRRAVVRHTGWPEFWVPTRAGIEPVPVDNLIECWIGAPHAESRFHDSSHADFWRASPEGRMFLLRGYVEDSPRALEGRGFQVGHTFDITLPTWRVGECLFHAATLASLIVPEQKLTIMFRVRWYGLRGRQLVSLNADRIMFGEYAARQGEFESQTTVDLVQITDNLPEIVSTVVAPLYERFQFFRLPATLVSEELAKMKASRTI